MSKHEFSSSTSRFSVLGCWRTVGLAESLDSLTSGNRTLAANASVHTVTTTAGMRGDLRLA
jgi:hypothetical protein